MRRGRTKKKKKIALHNQTIVVDRRREPRVTHSNACSQKTPVM